MATVYVIGDSTVASYADHRPLTGWGQRIHYFLTLPVENRAHSGASSKSFMADYWSPLAPLLAPGDFLIIQFGHNDEKTDERGTLPWGDYQTYLEAYIDAAETAGATPILTTPMHRNTWEDSVIVSSHGQYPDAMRDVATRRSVGLVDFTSLTEAAWNLIGETATSWDFFLYLEPGIWPQYSSGYADDAHFSFVGAHALAKLWAQNAPASIAPYVRNV